MRFFAISLIFGFASSTFCPNSAWTYNSAENSCAPAADSGFSFTCNNDGSITVNFKLEHLYSYVANSFASDAAAVLSSNSATGPVNDVFTFSAKAMTFSQSTSEIIVGSFTLAGELFTEEITDDNGDISTLELSDPISTTITCQFSSSVDTSTDLEISKGATIAGTTSTVNLADAMVATLSSNGESRTSFTIGETVEVSISEPEAFAAAGAIAKIKECTVYENIQQLTNPIPLLKSSSCGMNVLSAAATDEFNFSFRNGSSKISRFQKSVRFLSNYQK